MAASRALTVWQACADEATRFASAARPAIPAGARPARAAGPARREAPPRRTERVSLAARPAVPKLPVDAARGARAAPRTHPAPGPWACAVVLPAALGAVQAIAAPRTVCSRDPARQCRECAQASAVSEAWPAAEEPVSLAEPARPEALARPIAPGVTGGYLRAAARVSTQAALRAPQSPRRWHRARRWRSRHRTPSTGRGSLPEESSPDRL